MPPQNRPDSQFDENSTPHMPSVKGSPKKRSYDDMIPETPLPQVMAPIDNQLTSKTLLVNNTLESITNVTSFKKHKTTFDKASPALQISYMQTTLTALARNQFTETDLKLAVDQFIELCNDADMMVYLGLDVLPAEASVEQYRQLEAIYQALYNKMVASQLNYKLEELQKAVQPLMFAELGAFATLDFQTQFQINQAILFQTRKQFILARNEILNAIDLLKAQDHIFDVSGTIGHYCQLLVNSLHVEIKMMIDDKGSLHAHGARPIVHLIYEIRSVITLLGKMAVPPVKHDEKISELNDMITKLCIAGLRSTEALNAPELAAGFEQQLNEHLGLVIPPQAQDEIKKANFSAIVLHGPGSPVPSSHTSTNSVVSATETVTTPKVATPSKLVI